MSVEALIAESDEDMEISRSLSVEFDENRNFVISLSFTDFEYPERDYTTYAVIDSEEALQMAKWLRIPLTELPDEFDNRFGESSSVMLPSQVEELFSELLRFVLSCGVHYTLKESRP